MFCLLNLTYAAYGMPFVQKIKQSTNLKVLVQDLIYWDEVSSGSSDISLRNFAAYSKSVKGTDSGARTGRCDCSEKEAWISWDLADNTDRDLVGGMTSGRICSDLQSLVFSVSAVSDIIVFELSRYLEFWMLKVNGDYQFRSKNSL